MFWFLLLNFFLQSEAGALWGNKRVNLTDPSLLGRYNITEEVSRDIEFDLHIDINLSDSKYSVIVRSEIFDIEEEETRDPLYFIVSHSGSMKSWQVMITTRTF